MQLNQVNLFTIYLSSVLEKNLNQTIFTVVDFTVENATKCMSSTVCEADYWRTWIYWNSQENVMLTN